MCLQRVLRAHSRASSPDLKLSDMSRCALDEGPTATSELSQQLVFRTFVEFLCKQMKECSLRAVDDVVEGPLFGLSPLRGLLRPRHLRQSYFGQWMIRSVGRRRSARSPSGQSWWARPQGTKRRRRQSSTKRQWLTKRQWRGSAEWSSRSGRPCRAVRESYRF